MATLRTFIGVATIAALVQVAIGGSFTVGGQNGGWDLSTNLAAWAAAQKFNVGDTLTFNYASAHDVLEVSKADYDACATSKPTNSYTGGSTVVKLSSPGKRYFICGIPGHCSQGMKVEIDVVAAVTATPPTAAASPPLAKSFPPKAAASPPLSKSFPPKAAASPPLSKSFPPTAAASPPLSKSSPPMSKPEAPTSSKPSKAAPSEAPASSPATISPSSEPSASDLPVTTSPAPPPGSAANGLGRHAKVAMGFGLGMLLVWAV
ncbi:uclacyanin 1 [Phoenix dactylifera]|uniref:Uclacyanin 1 n=1 Tax=Phoenix dactylifera TaxID=42345 RepID=A0A8B7C838_PHODC|nr:uclacyanin 1 [Phoenix dactylifera]